MEKQYKVYVIIESGAEHDEMCEEVDETTHLATYDSLGKAIELRNTVISAAVNHRPPTQIYPGDVWATIETNTPVLIKAVEPALVDYAYAKGKCLHHVHLPRAEFLQKHTLLTRTKEVPVKLKYSSI
jgi:hypothetical protein